jgi:2',3'-cyclic-nucleotide 2'-phosphodiesterase (5'-nucleotidase family)
LKKRFLLTVFASVLAACLFAAPALAAEDTQDLVILHTNDVHGAFEASNSAIGHDVIAAIFDRYKAETNGAVLMLDAGDAAQGVYFVGQSRGEAAVEIMNAVGYDAMTVGNHEFDYGWPRLKELAALAEFPVLLPDSLSGGAENFKPCAVFERGGLRIGVFGLTTPEAGFKSVGGIELADGGKSFGDAESLVRDARAAVTKLRDEEKVDIVVCLAHLGTEDIGYGTSYDVRDNVEGIDVIIDGHSHTALADIGQAEGKALIASTGSSSAALGVLAFAKGEDGRYAVSAHSVDKETASETAPKAEVSAVIADWSATVDKAGSEIVAELKQDIPLVRTLLRGGEAVAGNLVADAMRAASGADVAIENGGGVRDTNPSLPAGELTRKQIISVLPFGNVLQMAEVKGAVLKAALEHGVSSYPTLSGGFPQVSGVKFTFDPLAPAGARIAEIAVGGEALDPDKLYRLATNDFTGTLGGDNYTMLREPFSENPLPLKETGFATLDEVLIWYLTAHAGDVRYGLDGRIAVKRAFKDLSAEQNEAIAELTGAAGIIVGYEDGTFRPDDALTRAQLAAILTRLYDLTAPEEGTAAFTDVGESVWYAPYAYACAEAGYFVGYEDGTFRGGGEITYDEFANVVSRISGARPAFENGGAPATRMDVALALAA